MRVASVGAGQMAVQGNVGGGSFVCGLKRVLGPHTSLEASAVIGALHPMCHQKGCHCHSCTAILEFPLLMLLQGCTPVPILSGKSGQLCV